MSYFRLAPTQISFHVFYFVTTREMNIPDKEGLLQGG